MLKSIYDNRVRTQVRLVKIIQREKGMARNFPEKKDKELDPIKVQLKLLFIKHGKLKIT